MIVMCIVCTDEIRCYTPNVGDPFLGRDEIVESLAVALHSGKRIVSLITGPPGIGKSTVANAVCAHYLDNCRCQPKAKCYLIWFDTAVEKEDDLYEIVCSRLRWHGPPGKDGVESLFNVLPSHAIVLIDACENAKPYMINSFLTMARRANGELRFLLTSQVQMTRKEIKQPMKVDTLEPLSKECALQILKQPLEETEVDASCKEIVDIRDLLDGNPYALNLASCMMADEGCTPHQLLQLLKGGRERALSDSDGDEEGLNELFCQFFNLLKKEGELEYLSAISASIFHGKISQDSFHAVCVEVHSEFLSGQKSGREANSKLTGKLKRWHILQKCRDSTDLNNPQYRLHSYMREHAFGLLKKDVDLFRKVTRAFLLYFARFLTKTAREQETRKTPTDKVGLCALDEEYSNVKEFLTQLTDPQNEVLIQKSSELVDTMFREDVNCLLSFRFLHEKRRCTLKCLLKIVSEDTSIGNVWQGKLEMASILCGQGKFIEALQEATQSLEQCSESSESNQRKARCLEVMGTILLCQHHTGFSEAEKCLKEAYDLLHVDLQHLTELSEDDETKCTRRRTGSVCRKLGELYSRQNRFNDANHMLNECKSHFCHFLGPDALLYVWLHHRIGGNLQTQGERKKAESEYLEGLRLCCSYEVTQHPIYAKLNYSLGRLYLYKDTKDTKKSLEHFSDALALQKKIDSSHPDVAQTYIGIGRVYNDMAGNDPGNVQLALDMFEEAEKILEETAQDTGNYPDLRIAELYSSQAYSYRNQEKFDAELKCLQKGMKVYTDQPTPNDSLKKKMATCLTDMGHACRRLGKRKEMGKYFAEARKLGGKAKGRQK